MEPGRWRFPLALEGRRVRLVPLTRAHASALAWAARDPEVSRYLRSPLPGLPEQMGEVIDVRLRLAGHASLIPFVTALRSSGQVVGTTNFAHPDPPNESVEIGGTWTDSAFWRTPVNTESKYLLLRYAFEEGGAHRVHLQTDARNERSRHAIERLGARAETTFREDVHLGEGRYRTSVYYGILASEWPGVRRRLESFLDRDWIAPVASPGTSASRTVGPLAPTPFRIQPPPATPSAFPAAELPTLEGMHVTLVPLAREQIPQLAFAGRDPEVWRYLRIGPAQDVASMTTLVDMLLDQQLQGSVRPFAIVLRRDSRPAGIVRYLDIDRQNGQVELGTWIDSALWRTPVNTEVKYLALRHAFEAQHVHRVHLRTDSRNARSQRAIERLGAQREGILREYLVRPGGYRRSSVCYSILGSEWTRVRARLEEMLAVPWDWAVSKTPRPEIA